MKHVVIVGGGFGGISAAKKLAGENVDVTIVDRHNYHLFQPLLYQVATAGLTTADIASPIRSIFSEYSNIRVLLGEVKDIDLNERKVKTSFGEIDYDYLILACGAESSYFSHPDWREVAPSLKTLEQAIEIRRRILMAYEEAEKEKDTVKKAELLTFVIVGGGPTGVELAGAIAEIARQTLYRDFRSIDPQQTRVILIEGGPRILNSFPVELAEKATNHLRNMGVDVITNLRVDEITSEFVRSHEVRLRARTVIWAAGVKPSRLTANLKVEKDGQGRVIVTSDLSLLSDPQVFVVGDMANVQGPNKMPLPGLAPVAMQEGRHAARMILGDLKSKSRAEFVYVDKGQMATIGRKRAIVQIGKLKFNGTLAWLTWLVVHIYYLIGFRNKIFVILQWAWSYLTFKKGARLIVEKDWRLES